VLFNAGCNEQVFSPNVVCVFSSDPSCRFSRNDLQTDLRQISFQDLGKKDLFIVTGNAMHPAFKSYYYSNKKKES